MTIVKEQKGKFYSGRLIQWGLAVGDSTSNTRKCGNL